MSNKKGKGPGPPTSLPTTKATPTPAPPVKKASPPVKKVTPTRAPLKPPPPQAPSSATPRLAAAAAPAAVQLNAAQILGAHPAASVFGLLTTATDGHTASNVPHRQLVEKANGRAATVAALKPILTRHHASPEALERTRKQNEALDRLGLGALGTRLRRFPTSSSTRKGNLAEIVLAEYVTAVGGLTLPVYRLRHNTNVDQSMKGDDVLAFDLDSTPSRILIGETKFRGLSAVQAVREIAEGLVKSHKAGLPASLQFVADQLFEAGQHDLGAKVMNCVVLMAQNRLRLDYVGLLLSDHRAAERVNAATPTGLARLVMISLGVNAPDALVDDCFAGLE